MLLLLDRGIVLHLVTLEKIPAAAAVTSVVGAVITDAPLLLLLLLLGVV